MEVEPDAGSRAPDAGRRAAEPPAGASTPPGSSSRRRTAIRRWSRSPARPASASARCTGTGRAVRRSSRRSTATTSPASPRCAEQHRAEQAAVGRARTLAARLPRLTRRAKRGMLAELGASVRRASRAAHRVAPPGARRGGDRARARAAAGVVRADLTAADLVQLVRGMVLPAITPPEPLPVPPRRRARRHPRLTAARQPYCSTSVRGAVE